MLNSLVMNKGVNVVIENGEGKLLVLKRSGRGTKFYPGYWNFPGGSAEQGEELLKAAKREAKEEANLDVELDGGYFAIYYYPDGEKENAEAAVYAFKAKIIGGTLQLNKEHTEYKWVSKNDWQDLSCTPSCEAILRRLFQ